MNAAQVIARKRDGHVLTEEEIQFLIGGYTKGTIPDYQMASFLAFVYCKVAFVSSSVVLRVVWRWMSSHVFIIFFKGHDE